MGSLGVLIGLVVLVVIPMPVDATTFPGRNGAIAFSGGAAEGRGIWKVASKGGMKELMARGAHSPAWSPDGQTLVLVSGTTLERMNADGDARHDLTPHSHGIESAPSWSPNGQRIAFVRQETVGSSNVKRSAIITVNSRNGEEKNVSGWVYSGRVASPSWSPDGHQLVYERSENDIRRLLIKNLMTSRSRIVTTLSDNVDSHVSWSPAGNKLLYKDSSNDMYTIWTDGSHRTVISDGDSYEASWSPDGNRIAFLEDKNGGEISISMEDGSVVQLPVQKSHYQRLAFPAWSPDGKKLAVAMQYGEGASQVSDVFTYDLTGDSQVPTWLASGNFGEFTWQPRR